MINRILIGGVLFSAISSTASGQFTRVLGNEDLSPGDPTLSTSRSIALSSTEILSLVDVGLGVNRRLIASEYVGGTWIHTELAGAGDAVFGGGENFLDFASLSLSPGVSAPVVTFVGLSDGSSGQGVYQVGFDGSGAVAVATNGGSIAGRGTVFGSALRIGTNASGAVAFGAADGGDDVLWRYNGTHTTLADTQTPASLTGFNEGLTDVYPKYRVVTSTGSAVGFAKDGSAGAIYEFTDSTTSITGASPRVAASGVAIGAKTFVPVQALGATAGATGSTLFVGVNEDDKAQVIHQDGAGTITSMGPEFDAAFATSISGVRPSGTMTEGGRSVVFIPGGDFGDQGTLHYLSSSVGAVQSIGPGSVVGDFTLAAIGLGAGAQPAVNEQGWVVLDGTAQSGEDLLIAWNPEQGAGPIAIAYVGQQFTLAGDSEIYTVAAINIRGAAEFDTDVFKDLLAEDGTVVFGVVYTDSALNQFDAVVTYNLSAVPEPAGIAVMVGGAGLLLRRRRGGRSGSATGATADLA